jgi:hypothetical protein
MKTPEEWTRLVQAIEKRDELENEVDTRRKYRSAGSRRNLARHRVR